MSIVTVGLSVYNAAPFLADAIQSVLNQTLTDWELLIVDDGSTDDSLAVAQSFADPRIRVLAGGTNRGLPARLNEITRLARGKYLARMGADDIMTPDRLQLQISFMETNPGVDVAGAFAYIIDTHNNVCGVRGTTDLPATLGRAAGGVPLIHPTVVARTNWFRQYPYREEYRRAEDYELWLRTIETSSFRVIGQPLLFYREQGLPLLKKYTRAAVDVRNTVRFHRHALTPWRFSRVLLASYGKEIIYKVAGAVGLVDALVRRRTRSLPPHTREEAQLLLTQAVSATILPSLID